MSLKTALRDGAAQILLLSGLTAPDRRARGHLSIATFHRVLPQSERLAYPYPGLAVTPTELDAFLGYLEQHFDCGTLAAQHSRFLSGEVAMRPLMAITFDDGQYDNYLHARPVLARHGIKASFFAPVEAVRRQELLWHDRLGFAVLALLEKGAEGRARLDSALRLAGVADKGPRNTAGNLVQASKTLGLAERLRLVEALEDAAGSAAGPDFARLMTFEELGVLAGEGHEIGSHSMTHCLMPECDDTALDYELSESRAILEARLGCPVKSFCYPNGDCDNRTAAAASRAGYGRAVTTAWGNNDRDADPYQLRRFDMVAAHVSDADGKFLPELLAFRMSGLYPGLGA
jgi:peptidoglycan/xylan/chitin deacetylase (PgdA/CDA1 family)